MRTLYKLLILSFAFCLAPAFAQQGTSLSYPTEGNVLSADSNTIYFSPGAAYYEEFRITVGSSTGGSDIYDSGTRNLFVDGWEHNIGGVSNGGAPVYLRFYQRNVSNGWQSFDTQFTSAGSGPVAPVPVTPVAPGTPGPVTPSTPSNNSAGQTPDPIVIDWPTSSETITSFNSTLYFSPRGSAFDQFRITVGSSQDSIELFDSGTRDWSVDGWEYQLQNVSSYTPTVYVKIWQRGFGGSWTTSTNVFSTNGNGSAPTNLVPSQPAPVEPPAPTQPTAPTIPTTPSVPGTLPSNPGTAPDPIVIDYPPAGATLTTFDSTIYFSPRSTPFDEYRVTVGSSSGATDLYDSGTRDFTQQGWELQLQNVSAYTSTVYLTMWQRAYGGSWLVSSTLYNGTGNGGGNPTTPTQPTTPTTPTTPQQPQTPNGNTVTSLAATHRSGQTFLTWNELGSSSGYHVYRHTSPISSGNFNDAERLTTRWGPLDNETSFNRDARGGTPQNFVINDNGSPLSNQTGLFVHTSQNSGNFYYAVTSIINGNEVIAMSSGNNSLINGVSESVNTPAPVLAYSQGNGRVYTHYMNYADWNPTHSGYAYNYSVALPAGYDPTRVYPLMVELHAYSDPSKVLSQAEYGWQVIQLTPSDPGAYAGSIHSWWYGYATNHNFNNGGTPNSGSVTNYTEQRVMKAIDEVTSRFPVDTSRIHMWGHSMGASGTLSYGMRYGNRISGIYASQPMTDYRTSTLFQDEFEKLWGSQGANLPIRNRGSYSSNISGADGTGVWDWLNHQQQLSQRRGSDMAYLMVEHGKADTVIDWQTQGEPMARALNNSKHGFSARSENTSHSFMGFQAVVTSLFGLGIGAEAEWRYSSQMSFPAISNASGSGALFPGNSGTHEYNTNLQWATPQTPFAGNIVDNSNLYQISIRSFAGNQNADITPRNTQSFNPGSGTFCQWSATDNNSGGNIGSGGLSIDGNGLATATGVPIRNGVGTLLTIDCR